MMVDQNRVEGAAKNFGGKLEEAMGGMTGDAETQVRGQAHQAEGTAQNTFGSAVDAAREWSGNIADMTKDKPLTALVVAMAVGYMLRALTHARR